MTEDTLWTKDFILMSMINFVTFLIFFLLMVTIASYAVDMFHASTKIAGLVSGISIIGVLVGRLGTGYVIEGAGSKKVLMAGSVVYIITSILYFVAVNLPLLTIIRLLHGIAYGVVSTAAGTIVAWIIPPGRRGEGIGYYSMSAVMATALGPFVGILLIQYADFKMIFIVNTMLAVISLAVSSVVSEPGIKAAAVTTDRPVKKIHVSDFLELKAVPISTIALIVGFSYSGVISFMSLYAQQIHLENAAGFYFLVYAFTVLISRPFSGRLLDIKGAKFIMYPCLLIFAVGMLLFSQASQGYILILSGVVIGLGYGNFFSGAQAISLKVSPAHRLGLATATFFIFLDLGLGLGPYLLGSLIPYTGYRGLYSLMVVVILLTIILYYFWDRKNRSFG